MVGRQVSTGDKDSSWQILKASSMGRKERDQLCRGFIKGKCPCLMGSRRK